MPGVLPYLLVFLVPALMPAAALLLWLGAPGAVAGFFPLFFLFVLLPLADYALGRDTRNPPDEASAARVEADPRYRWITLACLPVQLLLLAWSMHAFATLPLGDVGRIGWLISQGVVGGVLAINVAHELIHRRERLEQHVGGWLLATVGYVGFKIEHLRGHHVHVATPADASSARRGEGVYGFVARALMRNVAAAWRLEAQRLGSVGLPWWSVQNEMIRWTLAWCALAALAFAWAGTTGLLFFLAQGLIAAISLEIINYVEHYGLERERLPSGRYERVDHHHSWNSSYRLSNWILLQLQRHSDHHAEARRRYQALRHHDDSPQLPGGYAAMFVLALVPPAWRWVMDRRVPERQAREA